MLGLGIAAAKILNSSAAGLTNLSPSRGLWHKPYPADYSIPGVSPKAKTRKRAKQRAQKLARKKSRR